MNFPHVSYWVTCLKLGRDVVECVAGEMRMLPSNHQFAQLVVTEADGFFTSFTTCRKSLPLHTIIYEIHGMGSDGMTFKKGVYRHEFKPGAAVVSQGFIQAKKLFRTQPLSDLLDSHLFDPMKGVQFIA